MIAISLKQLADIIDAKLIADDNSVMIESVSIDTRKITNQTVFIALKGQNHDAHDFVPQAVEAGAVAVIVSHPLATTVPQLIVADTRLALGQFAAWVRAQVKTRIVALTGSSGKTSVKEMTASILSQCGKTLATAGNLNNDIGVPLTLLRLTPEYDYAVVELGANHIGEIAYTTQLVKPEAALINNLLAAHIEGFGSLAGVAKAKGEIFEGLQSGQIAIINEDNLALDAWAPLLIDKKVWRFGVDTQKTVDFYATGIKVSPLGTQFELHSPFGSISVSLPLLGRHNVSNALAAAALAMAVGANLSAVQAGLAVLTPVEGRLFPIVLSPTQLVLDDSYNANVGSMIAAADVLAMMPGYKIMVVGDMGELGNDAIAYHREVGEAIQPLAIDHVLSVGNLSQAISDASGKGEHFSEQTQLVERLKTLLQQHTHCTILVKGSRSAGMERVIAQINNKS